MSLFNQDFVVDAGRDWAKDIYLLDANNAPTVDLRGYTITGSLKPVVFPYTSVANFICTFISAIAGQFTIALDATDTEGLTDERYEYEIVLTSGNTSYSLLKGFLTISSEVPAYVIPTE